MRLLGALCVSLCLSGVALAQSAFDAQVAGWTSHRDVAQWLEANFAFDSSRLDTILERTKRSGPGGLLARSPAGTFESKRGYCTDAAAFAIGALNRIDPAHDAKYVFIRNQYGQPHHWVAAYKVDGKIMVMDYGAGPEWASMKGVHGPYESLDQYADFLRGLSIKNFAPASVEWRKVFPGQED